MTKEERRTETVSHRVSLATKNQLAWLRAEYGASKADVLTWGAKHFPAKETFLLFQCKTEDCDQRPFIITRSDLDLAEEIINCEICDVQCVEIKLKEKQND